MTFDKVNKLFLYLHLQISFVDSFNVWGIRTLTICQDLAAGAFPEDPLTLSDLIYANHSLFASGLLTLFSTKSHIMKKKQNKTNISTSPQT